jgi:DNA-binding NtrC family response regulator
MEHHLRNWSYQVECVKEKSELLRQLAKRRPDLLLMDVRFGEYDGVEILRQLWAEYPELKAAVLTAYGSIDNAITAIRLGAIDYLTKPLDLGRLRSVVELSLDRPCREEPSRSEQAPSEQSELRRPLVGESQVMKDLRALIERVAATDATAFILGESGTGKELVARAVHEQSPRSRRAFVPLNVAALPRDLIENTLFGHAKGAFTGADQTQSGCCEAADGGTLFLDEIGEMEIGLQAKLLRFLQEHSFQRVGQSQLVRVDVRIVAATNRDPLEQVRRGSFREDLYYRLNVIPIVLPPLRDRREDVPLLAAHFLKKSAARCGRGPLEFTNEALAELRNHPWPGNVRELENIVTRLAILSPGPAIGVNDVRTELRKATDTGRRPDSSAAPAPTASAMPSDGWGEQLRPMDRMEYEAIVQALAETNGNVRDAARKLGLGQATIYRKIKKYNIST